MMFRRPKRHHQPLTFSRFARVSASIRNVKHQMHESKAYNISLTSHSQGDRQAKQDLEEKNQLSDSSEENDFHGDVQADFAFFDPKPDDFHLVKALLLTYLDSTEWELSGFVDLILKQTTVGTVVKIEDDEDTGLFSVITALNLDRYKDHVCIKELREFLLLKACKQDDVIERLRLLLEDASNVGLLVSQRVVNLPPQLLPPLYDSLFDEISWATEDEPTEELRKSFHFKCYLIVTKIYQHRNANQKSWQNSHSDEVVIYVKPEDEIFQQLCLWSFMFPMHTQQEVTAPELKSYKSVGLVMLVEADKISMFRKELHSLIDES